MHHANGKTLFRAKSYTSIYDIFGSHPFNNVLYRNPNKAYTEVSVFRAKCSESHSDKKASVTPLITSERYHFLNKDISYGSVIRSTSTIFYDLDEIARRQSFTCYLELNSSREDFVRKRKTKHVNGFVCESDAIVQECATQMTPKLLPRDSIEFNTKKTKRKFPNEVELSSEIFLRDNDYEESFRNISTNNNNNNQTYFEREPTDRHQKFWSYAKYRTEYTRPIGGDDKKIRKKDQGKRTAEDPCPCQLFSYACPCINNKKSQIELTGQSKSTELLTSVFFPEEKRRERAKMKKKQNDIVKDSKLTNTSFAHKTKIEDNPRAEPASHPSDIPAPSAAAIDLKPSEKVSLRSKTKSIKRLRQVVCPKCKEKVEIVSSDEEIMSKLNSVDYGNNEITSAAYTYSPGVSSKNVKNKNVEDGDFCNHEPPCEMVPICQLLSDNSTTPKVVKRSSPKSSPRIIKITKACRHHPPCTVVPSCQRATVLKNNCEYIPPCMHRPRCVNLPLCVPLSKTFNLQDFTCNHLEVEEKCASECPHVPKCKYVPECLQDSVENSVNHQFSAAPQLQNTEYYNQYGFTIQNNTATRTVTPNTICAPCHVASPLNFICKITKSCQYDYADCKSALKESVSDAVIFIRDVGCQFRNKALMPIDSLVRSKPSSASLDYADMKLGNYYTGVHTLRYEDKYTNPESRMTIYVSSDTMSSTGFDSQCPSHGLQARVARPTGFVSRSAYVTAFAYGGRVHPPKAIKQRHASLIHTTPVKSKKSLLKNKYKKMFNRRRKTKTSSLLVNCCSRKAISQKSIVK